MNEAGEQSLVYSDDYKDRTIVVTSDSIGGEKRKKLKKQGIKLWPIRPQPSIEFWKTFQEKCTESGLTGIFFEGGATILSDLLKYRLIDYLFAYRAPRILGDNEARSVFFGQNPEIIDDGIALVDVKHENFGPDQMMRGYFRYPL